MLGDVGGGEAWPGGSDSAYFGAFDVEAVAEEAEHLFDVLADGSADLFAEECGASAMLAADAALGVGLVEEAANFFDEGALAAEVDGALASVLSPCEAAVGTEAAPAVGSPGFDDGALVGEARGIFAEEGEGFVVGCGRGHAYMHSRLAEFLNRRTEQLGSFLEGVGGGDRAGGRCEVSLGLAVVCSQAFLLTDWAVSGTDWFAPFSGILISETGFWDSVAQTCVD